MSTESVCEEIQDLSHHEWHQIAKAIRTEAVDTCESLYPDDGGKRHACRVGIEEATSSGKVSAACDHIIGD